MEEIGAKNFFSFFMDKKKKFIFDIEFQTIKDTF